MRQLCALLGFQKSLLTRIAERPVDEIACDLWGVIDKAKGRGDFILHGLVLPDSNGKALPALHDAVKGYKSWLEIDLNKESAGHEVLSVSRQNLYVGAPILLVAAKGYRGIDATVHEIKWNASKPVNVEIILI